MTASLYQRGSVAAAAVARLAAGRRSAMAVVTDRFSQVMLEFGFAAQPRLDVEDDRRADRRVQLHPVARSLPEIGRAVDEIDGLVYPRRIDPQLLQRQLQRAAPDLAGIQVDHRQHDIREVRCSLRVGDEPLVADWVKRQAVVGLERAMLVTDPIDPADELGEAVRPVDLPASELVLL